MCIRTQAPSLPLFLSLSHTLSRYTPKFPTQLQLLAHLSLLCFGTSNLSFLSLELPAKSMILWKNFSWRRNLPTFIASNFYHGKNFFTLVTFERMNLIPLTHEPLELGTISDLRLWRSKHSIRSFNKKVEPWWSSLLFWSIEHFRLAPETG